MTTTAVEQAAAPVAAAPIAAEEAFAFDCEGETLLGILHRGAAGAPTEAGATGVVVVVGGPQYRAGSHRQFVHLARHLAAAGHPVLRFDVRGMGDASGALRTFEQITPDIGAAIDQLVQRAPDVRRVVLWGLCDGASAALLYLDERGDGRVRGLSLVNPWVRTERSQAQTQVRHYYRDRLLSPAFWRKLAGGGVGLDALRGLLRSLRAARAAPAAGAAASLPYTARMARALGGFGGPVHLTLSGRDYTAREFEEHAASDAGWRAALTAARPCTDRLPDADHTFSTGAGKRELAARTVEWLAGRAPTDR